MRKLWREPLLHFFLLGTLLFLLGGSTRGPGGARSTSIRVTQADLDRLSAVWQTQWGRPPNGQEMLALVRGWVREEVLYREALAMGLDRDDTIIRRRLVQKMEFLSEDTTEPGEPGEEELAAFLAANPERFTVPARVDFEHVYVSSDQRGEQAEADARALLAELRAGRADPRDLGDRFMLQREYVRKSQTEIAQLFGRDFAEQLFALEPGDWCGPVVSGYGLHLVRVRSRSEPRLPSVDEIRPELARELLADRSRQANRRAYERIRDRYDITFDDPALAARRADILAGPP